MNLGKLLWSMFWLSCLCVSLRKGLCELSGIREKWMELWNKIMKCQMDNMCKETNCKEKIGMALVY